MHDEFIAASPRHPLSSSAASKHYLQAGKSAEMGFLRRSKHVSFWLAGSAALGLAQPHVH